MVFKLNHSHFTEEKINYVRNVYDLLHYTLSYRQKGFNFYVEKVKPFQNCEAIIQFFEENLLVFHKVLTKATNKFYQNCI